MKRHVFFLLCIFTSTALLAEQSITLESPRGGWRNSAFTEERDTEYAAAYPKPPVDRGRQKNRTLILGKLHQAGKLRQPGRFIVNGITMPLYTDQQGSFVKPWAFGPGSNNVEIISPDGGKRRVQFFEAHTGKTRSKLRIVLGWNDAHAEVDMHVLTPDGEHAFWARPLLKKGGGLDVDSVDGGGPEIFSTATPIPGNYLIYVNYWGNFTAAGYNFNPDAHEVPMITTRVTIINEENTPDERQETITVPLRRIGDLVFVRAIRITERM